MDAKAYVLIEAEAGQIGAVVVALREFPAIRAADIVTGPYDIIAVIETTEQNYPKLSMAHPTPYRWLRPSTSTNTEPND